MQISLHFGTFRMNMSVANNAIWWQLVRIRHISAIYRLLATFLVVYVWVTSVIGALVLKSSEGKQNHGS